MPGEGFPLHAWQRHWRGVLLRGAWGVSVSLSLLLLAALIPNLGALTLAWGTFVLVDGALALNIGFGRRHEDTLWLIVLSGIAGVVVGTAAWVDPVTITRSLVPVVSIWAAVRGVLAILAGIQMREVYDERMLGLAGAFALAAAAALACWPEPGLIPITVLLGGYALLASVTEIVLALGLRATVHRAPAHDGQMHGELEPMHGELDP